MADLLLKPNGSKYELAKEYTYRDITIPIGYKTDGISYKFRLIGIFINRFDPRYIEAVLVHDYLTDKNEWDKANRYFEELLPNTVTSELMIDAVKLYSKIKGY
jgi:hypothetical protein